MNKRNDDDLHSQGSEAANSEPGEAGPTGQRPGSDPALPREIGGRQGPEPTRFGDWEKNGRCIDF
jgi:hypothetical protein